MKRTMHICSGLMVLLLFAGAGHAKNGQGDDDKTKEALQQLLSGKATEKDMRKFVKRVAETVTNAAHPTGTNPGMDSYSFERKGNSRVLSIESHYFGGFTQKKYTATIEIVIDMTDPDEPEIDKIAFDDNENKIKPNQANLGKLQSSLNKLLSQ